MSEANPEGASFATCAEAVEWLTRLFPVGEKPGLERMEALMARLGHPQRGLRFIHVAGTNGKGSTCAFLTRTLMRAGYNVGTYTSPYLETFADRIRFNGENIAEADLLQLANRVKPVVDELKQSPLQAPTMFEVATAIALLYYADVARPDYVVWETGMGGRLDATNIVTPVVSIITNVGHDHMERLGDTLAKVAFEKAGIIKHGVPVVSAVEQPDAIEVIGDVARRRHSPLYLMGRDFAPSPAIIGQDGQTFHFRGPYRHIPDVTIRMNGAHQVKNAAVALMALEALRHRGELRMADADLYAGMREAAWPGRLETVSDSPRIVLDGAHNPEGAESLAAALRSYYTYRRLRLMLGMLSAKNHTGYFRHILPLVDTLIITEPEWFKKLDAARLAELAEPLKRELKPDMEIIVEPDWRAALDVLKEKTEDGDLAVVTGTLYLISDVRSRIVRRS